MQSFAVPVLPSAVAFDRVPRWWPAPIATFASGSMRFLPDFAGRYARPRAAPRRGPKPNQQHLKQSSSIPGLPDLDRGEFLKDFRRLSRSGPGDGGRKFVSGEPARTAPAGTSLRLAPQPGYRFSRLEHGADSG